MRSRIPSRFLLALATLASLSILFVPATVMAQTTTVVDSIPLTDFPSGQVLRPSRALPVGLDFVTVQLAPTTGNSSTPFQGIADPFNVVSKAFTFGIMWSWDSGATFPESTEGTIQGNPSGQWIGPKGNTMTPRVELGVPGNLSLGGVPNRYRGYASLTGGHASTAITISETTG